jgi:sulfur-oxidizing protein SoxZ
MATAVKPRIKLDRKEVKAGDIVEVKALVSHIMETGQRKDPQGNTIPRKILNKFTPTSSSSSRRPNPARWC